MSDYKLIGFRRSPRKFKKYDGALQDDEGKIKYVPFGDLRYKSFRDKTGLNMYPVHSDEKRRANYRVRHKHHLRKGFYSPSYFSYYYLW